MKSSFTKIQKLSAGKESDESIESDFDENELYHIKNMSLDEKKEKLEQSKWEFEYELENTYDIEIQNGINCIHDNKVNNIPL